MPQSKIRHEPAPQIKAVDVAETVSLDGLRNLSLSQLRRLWRERMGRKDPPKIKSLLLRELAWHDQQASQGGIDAQTQALLKSAVKQAKSAPIGHSPRPKRTPKNQPCTKLDLKPGTKLIRTWHGRKHEVIVRDKATSVPGDGGGARFEYQGQIFRGLTAIAEKITGAHWSGPRFFGLNRVKSIR